MNRKLELLAFSISIKGKPYPCQLPDPFFKSIESFKNVEEKAKKASDALRKIQNVVSSGGMIRSGHGWRSLNSLKKVREEQLAFSLRKFEKKDPLSLIDYSSEKVQLFLNRPLSDSELRAFYARNGKYKGNNKPLKRYFL